MPIPNIDQGWKQCDDLPHPSDGPLATQRHAQMDYQHKVAQDKIAEASEPKRTLPGTGSPERCPWDCLDKV